MPCAYCGTEECQIPDPKPHCIDCGEPVRMERVHDGFYPNGDERIGYRYRCPQGHSRQHATYRTKEDSHA